LDTSKIENLIKEMQSLIETPGADAEDTIEAIRIKMAAFLARNPEEAGELQEMTKSEFVQRRAMQMISEMSGNDTDQE